MTDLESNPAPSIRSARRGTGAASTSRSSASTRRRSSSASSTSEGVETRRARAVALGLRVARLRRRAAVRGSATAGAFTGPSRPREGHRFNPNKLLVDPYARALDGPVRPARAGLRLPARSRRRRSRASTSATTRRASRSAVVVDDAFDWGGDRAAARALARHGALRAAREGLHQAAPGRARGAARHVPRRLASDAAIAHLRVARASRRSSSCPCTSTSTSRRSSRAV